MGDEELEMAQKELSRLQEKYAMLVDDDLVHIERKLSRRRNASVDATDSLVGTSHRRSDGPGADAAAGLFVLVIGIAIPKSMRPHSPERQSLEISSSEGFHNPGEMLQLDLRLPNGSLIAWGTQMGRKDAAQLLLQTPAEEKAAVSDDWNFVFAQTIVMRGRRHGRGHDRELQIALPIGAAPWSSLPEKSFPNV